MRQAAVLLMVLGLTACASATTNISGTADYDTLRRAHDDCAAKGGTLVLKDGGNSQWIQDYTCKRA